eukprot:2218895-Prymnesium_polylepis.1
MLDVRVLPYLPACSMKSFSISRYLQVIARARSVSRPLLSCGHSACALSSSALVRAPCTQRPHTARPHTTQRPYTGQRPHTKRPCTSARGVCVCSIYTHSTPDVRELRRREREYFVYQVVAQDILVRESDSNGVEAVGPQEFHVERQVIALPLPTEANAGEWLRREIERGGVLMQMVLVMETAETFPIGSLEDERLTCEMQASKRALVGVPGGGVWRAR